jgi:hypothetical protein
LALYIQYLSATACFASALHCIDGRVDRHFVRYHKTGSLMPDIQQLRVHAACCVRHLGHTACAASGWPTVHDSCSITRPQSGAAVVCAHLLLCAAKRVNVVDINRACAARPAAEVIECGTRRITLALRCALSQLSAYMSAHIVWVMQRWSQVQFPDVFLQRVRELSKAYMMRHVCSGDGKHAAVQHLRRDWQASSDLL